MPAGTLPCQVPRDPPGSYVGFNTCVSSWRRPCNTILPDALIRRLFGMRCCLGYDLRQGRQCWKTTSWNGGQWLSNLPPALRKGTSSLIMLTAWWIWKHHNAVIFDNELPSTSSPLDTILCQARSSASAGAIGLRALIRHST